VIEIRITKDEAGVRIAFYCDPGGDGEEYSDYITANAPLELWDNEPELIHMMHRLVTGAMSAIDDQFLHEQLMKRKGADQDGSISS
jgi:hypothetical protein